MTFFLYGNVKCWTLHDKLFLDSNIPTTVQWTVKKSCSEDEVYWVMYFLKPDPEVSITLVLDFWITADNILELDLQTNTTVMIFIQRKWNCRKLEANQR